MKRSKVIINDKILDSELVKTSINIDYSLYLNCSYVTDNGLIPFLKRNRPYITEIHMFNGSNITELSFQELSLIKLESITLSSMKVYIDKLLSTRLMDHLTTLKIINCTNLKSEYFKNISEFYNIDRISFKDCGNQVDDNSINYLQEICPSNLNFSGTSITDNTLLSLIRFHRLESLDVSNNNITDQGLKGMKGSLKVLNFSSTKIQDEGILGMELDKDSLCSLNIAKTGVTDIGLKSIINQQVNIREIDLKLTKVTEVGIKELLKLKVLRRLRLPSRHIYKEAIAEVQERFPYCTIYV